MTAKEEDLGDTLITLMLSLAWLASTLFTIAGLIVLGYLFDWRATAIGFVVLISSSIGLGIQKTITDRKKGQ